MASNTRSDFVIKVEELLKSDETLKAIEVFSDSINVSEVKNNSWDLIPMITTFLTSYHEKNKPKVFRCCESFINTVAENSNAEEALLQFIEELEECNNDIKFLSLIKPLQKVILRIPKRRVNSLAWGFNSIQSFLNKCDAPESTDVIGKEKLLLDSNESVVRIMNLYNELLFFYEIFVHEFPKDEEESKEQRCLICKCLVDLLGKPLVYLDMEIFNGIKSKARIIAEKIVFNIMQVNCDLISLLELRSDMRNGELITPDQLGIASLFYLVFHEHILIERVPKVYDPLYVFHHSLPLVNILFDASHNIVIEKGLKLIDSLLEHVKYFELPYRMLECGFHSKFCKNLAKIIVYNEIDVLRMISLRIYKKYLFAFETHGFYLLVYNLLIHLSHYGLIGYTITLYKDKLVSELSFNKDSISPYFKGDKLMMLLKKFCYLHKQEETDLVEVSDQIIAALNLLRFLALRDTSNVTDIWDHFKVLEDIYFTPLRKGINLSRAHYKLKIREINEDSVQKANPNTEVSIMVGGLNLNEMPRSEKLRVLESSLTVFDMVESLLARLLECIQHHNNHK